MIDLDVCVIWAPDGDVLPTRKPVNRFTYTPLYPVCLSRIRPNVYRRAWFWLWECKNCKSEMLDTATYITRCACDTAVGCMYPKVNDTACHTCGKEFTYLQRQAHHVIKYCSDECSRKAQGAHNTFRSLQKVSSEVTRFDRSMCIRGKYNTQCEYYAECQTHRVMGKLGPFYKKDKSCYTSYEYIMKDAV